MNFGLSHKVFRFVFVGNGNCIKNKDAEKQEGEEHLPLISQDQSDKIESSGEGMELTFLIMCVDKKTYIKYINKFLKNKIPAII